MSTRASPTNGRDLAYRPEVDGLRALAVIAVILFHAGFDWFSGGFVGVDVFFVISGYLITSIIIAEKHAGTFTLVGFYERRARRILPALFLVMLACLPFAWLWMMPSQLKSFANSMVAVTLFASNVLFWRESGYFDAAAELKPLLHTWSLGVEEQYYVLYPVFILVFWRLGLKRIAWLVVILAVVSLGLSEWGWRNKPTPNFYLAPTRAWELAIGSLLALRAVEPSPPGKVRRHLSETLAAVGLLLVVWAILTYDRNTPFPSVYALAPTVGTAMILAFAATSSGVGRVLSHKWLVGIGLVSYSAYLWHQPLFAFARIHATGPLTPPIALAMIVATLLIAYISWRYVEKPFRSRAMISRRQIAALGGAGSVLFLIIGTVAIVSEGFLSRFPPEQRELVRHIGNPEDGRYVVKRFFELQGDFTASNKMKMLVVGDSFAQDFINEVAEGGFLRDYEIRTASVPAVCQIYFGPEDVSRFVRKASDRVRCQQAPSTWHRNVPGADVIIFAADWSQWSAERLPQTIDNLNLGPTQRIFVIGGKRFGKVDIRNVLQLSAFDRSAVRADVNGDFLHVNTILRSSVQKESFVDHHLIICGVTRRCPQFTPDGALISFDGEHLTKEGATFVGRRVFSESPLVEL